MSETVNQENNNQATNDQNKGAETPKTFTQAEVDAVVSERLKREREKYKDFEALKEKAAKLDEIEANGKTELQKATEKAEKLEKELESIKKANEIRAIRDKVAEETGVPASLLSGETEDACKEQATAIMNFKSSDGYPNVQDGGELQGKQKGSTAQQFAEWMSRELK